MSTSFMNPLAGFPRTVLSEDVDGHPQFDIRCSTLTPLRAKASAVARHFLRWTIAGIVIFLILTHPRQGWDDMVELASIGILAYAVSAFFTGRAFVRVGRIRLTTQAIWVRRWYGWQRFNRNLEHSFGLLVHDLANDEARRNDLTTRRAAANRRVVQPGVYYGNSFHVALGYVGHRVDLLSVYGHCDASAIAARLQYCDRALNEALNMGGGVSARPGDEWNDAPGGLDHV